MNQRELMQYNLAQILQGDISYASYASCQSSIPDKQPTNPFQKRVFEKKLRRSSVVSQNINPNNQQSKQNNMQQYNDQIDRITTSTKIQIDKVKQIIKDKVKQISTYWVGKQKYQKINLLVNNYKQTMEFVQSYATQNCILIPTERNYCANNSIYHEEYASCTKSSEKYQNSKNNSKQIPSRISKKQTYQLPREHHHIKIQDNQQPSNTKKSVYETVLEQRKIKNNRKKK